MRVREIWLIDTFVNYVVARSISKQISLVVSNHVASYACNVWHFEWIPFYRIWMCVCCVLDGVRVDDGLYNTYSVVAQVEVHFCRGAGARVLWTDARKICGTGHRFHQSDGGWYYQWNDSVWTLILMVMACIACKSHSFVHSGYASFGSSPLRRK